MKLYVVAFTETVSFVDVRDEAKKVDPLCVVTVVEEGKSYEFQDELPAQCVADMFGGEVNVIEYDIKELLP
jgi:hypothetical protein